ncbi:hypothetical protein BX616_006319, partial [Lobosporangium transversale]
MDLQYQYASSAPGPYYYPPQQQQQQQQLTHPLDYDYSHDDQLGYPSSNTDQLYHRDMDPYHTNTKQSSSDSYTSTGSHSTKTNRNKSKNSNQSDTNDVQPTKTHKGKVFQCTGFGDCRMVFTRSEHLARHAR